MTNQDELQLMKELSPEQMGKLRSNVHPDWRGRVVRIRSLYVEKKTGRPLLCVEDVNTREVKPKDVLPSMFDTNFL